MKKIRDQKGFSLLENMLAATILAFALLGGMTVMQNATANTVNGDLGTIATEHANEKIEMVIADKTYSGYDYLDTDNYPVEEDVGIYEMTRTVTITEVDPDDLTTSMEGSGVKKVEVSVVWGSAAYQTVSISTLVSDV